ncbi:uncharacterized protein ColSpa_02552 [Colletotrichum spaethianum]|uniref:DUF2406 domain-containing protein n=1 Tax=Colletotrichum spaethianum TaxID=700344 RepID=A0AA37L5G3_9PEZI|nr:uncharacterized protein ColSpa_02552 [Colletotrichum spaethianum]GKT42371.1 uncharacterized protein ColSpa_02552 [Colletotrichum spaethianum]
MAEHHPLPALPPQHQQPNQQLYHDQAADFYDEPAQFPPYQQQYDQPQPVQPPPRVQPQTQAPAQKQPQSPHRRPRTFSFQSNKSHKSHKSSGSHPKIDLHETHQEKEAKRLHSKADPTVAMSEAEPSAVQAMTKTSLAPLRAIQHKDTTGNPISEPDRSNPTRSRWERPLDTIRSFEAAIDGGYRDRDRRQSYRSDAESVATWNRRSSYYANRSYETVTSAAGSGSSAEHAGYHTDPTSSDNSSIERAPAPKPEPVNDYGSGFNQGQSHQSPAFNLENGTPNGPQNGKGHAYSSVKQGPQISDKGANVLRRPVAAPPQQQQQPQQRPEAPAKRKSWFSRRFSKAS